MVPLCLGARASRMSLVQTAPLLARVGPTLLRPYSGAGGDRETNRAALSEAGVFSDEIETALLDGDIDVAVHCLKDAPTHDTPGLTMAAYAARDDIRDCLATRDGTGPSTPSPPAPPSPRRPCAAPPPCAPTAPTSTSPRSGGRSTNGCAPCTTPTAGWTPLSSRAAPWNASGSPMRKRVLEVHLVGQRPSPRGVDDTQ
ncbi:hypothetical protein GR131_27620 [Streptomyces sp. GF20]|nr:hypothetical protein GR131_27620 [Streptomyces sp. GF20]